MAKKNAKISNRKAGADYTPQLKAMREFNSLTYWQQQNRVDGELCCCVVRNNYTFRNGEWVQAPVAARWYMADKMIVELVFINDEIGNGKKPVYRPVTELESYTLGLMGINEDLSNALCDMRMGEPVDLRETNLEYYN